MEYANATAWIASSKLFQNIGGFSPTYFHYGEDDNFIDRLKYHNYSIRLLPNSSVYHDREHHSRGHFWKEVEHQKRKFLRKLSDPKSAPVKEIIRATKIQYFKKRIRGQKRDNIMEYHQLHGARSIGIENIQHNRNQSAILNGPFIPQPK